MQLAGKRFILTGAAGGIGQAFAIRAGGRRRAAAAGVAQ